MLLLAALVLAAQREAPRADALAAVPEDALVVFVLDDPEALRARTADSAWVELLSDPRLASLMAELARVTGELLSRYTLDEHRLDLGASWKALHGPVRAFLAGGAERATTAGIFVGLGDDRAALDQLVDGLWEGAARGGVASRTSHQGVAIELLEDPEAGEGAPDALARFECAGQLAVVVGDGREALLLAVRGAIDRATGRDPSRGFAGSPALAEARAAAGHRASVEVFVDMARLIDVFRPPARPRDEAEVDVARRAHDLGLTSSRWSYAAADLGAGEDLDLTLALHLGREGWLLDVMRLLGPLPAELLPLVPADCANVVLGRVDVGGTWKLVQDRMEQLDPDGLARMRAGIQQVQALLGFDLETDLLARIRGDFLQFDVRVPSEEAPEEVLAVFGADVPASLRWCAVVRFGLDEAREVADVAEGLIERSGVHARVESAQYGEHWIHALDSRLHWSFTDDALFVAQSPTALRAALARLGERDAPSIAHDPRFRSALERHRSAAWLVVGDTRANLQALLAALGALRGTTTELRVGLEREYGVSLEDDPVERLLHVLPAPDVVRDHLDGATSYALEVGSEHVAVRVSSR